MNKHKRKSMRLCDYDYSSEGGYFITIVTVNREPLFGRIVNGNMVLNDFGKIVREEWLQTGINRRNVEIYEDEFCIMPNHFHAIIWIVDINKNHVARMGDTARRVPTRFGKPVEGSLSTIIGAFKSAATRRINALRGVEGEMVWQSRFYEHIIRGERDYYEISEYIALNPAGWEKDQDYVKDFG
mgnify:CR=1 FL=1